MSLIQSSLSFFVTLLDTNPTLITLDVSFCCFIPGHKPESKSSFNILLFSSQDDEAPILTGFFFFFFFFFGFFRFCILFCLFVCCCCCHFDIDVCIYSTCACFDCQTDFDVNNAQCHELVIFYGV